MVKSNGLRGLILFFLVTAFSCLSTASSGFPADSIRVMWMEGKKYILHKVESKETWPLLAKRYNVSVSDLKNANSGVEQLKLGQIINVPSGVSASAGSVASPAPVIIDPPARQTTVAPAPSSVGRTPETYTVKKGETLYSISKRFNKSVEEMKTMNKLSLDILSEGQVLIVNYNSKPAATPTPKVSAVSSTTVAQPVSQQPPAPAVKTPVQEEKKEPAPIVVPVHNTGVSPAAGYEKPTKSISPVKKGNTGKTLMQITETGVATWIQDGQVKSDRYFALHRSAPIGTIIKVTNRMNNQFVYVKVVGSLPDTGENENIIIKVSQAVSTKLVALDPLFQAELSYGVMQ